MFSCRFSIFLDLLVQVGGEAEGCEICCDKIGQKIRPIFGIHFSGFLPKFPNFFQKLISFLRSICMINFFFVCPLLLDHSGTLGVYASGVDLYLKRTEFQKRASTSSLFFSGS